MRISIYVLALATNPPYFRGWMFSKIGSIGSIDPFGSIGSIGSFDSSDSAVFQSKMEGVYGKNRRPL